MECISAESITQEKYFILGFFLTNKNKKIKKCPTSKWRVFNSLVQKNRLHGRRGKGTAESFSREKLRQAPQKEGGEILCDPGWYFHTPDVHNKWDGDTHTTLLPTAVLPALN